MGVAVRCDQCGQTDDHPKVHVANGGVFHHDCLSADLKEQVIASSPKAEEIITKAEDGVHGDDLREHIIAAHQEDL